MDSKINKMKKGEILIWDAHFSPNEGRLPFSKVNESTLLTKMKIFEPYFTTKEFSSGLGLTLVFKIVKEHCGDIALKTKPNEGTTFYLNFPVQVGEKKLLGYKEIEL